MSYFILLYRIVRNFLWILRSKSSSNNLSDNLFRLAVKTKTAWLNRRSTGALDGMAVLDLTNTALIALWFSSIERDTFLSTKNWSISSFNIRMYVGLVVL